jgi:hypothetical protein
MWSALPFLAGAVVCFLIYHLNKQRLQDNPKLQAMEGATS